MNRFRTAEGRFRWCLSWSEWSRKGVIRRPKILILGSYEQMRGRCCWRQTAHLQPVGVLWGVQPRPAASIPRRGGLVGRPSASLSLPPLARSPSLVRSYVRTAGASTHPLRGAARGEHSERTCKRGDERQRSGDSAYSYLISHLSTQSRVSCPGLRFYESTIVPHLTSEIE